MGSFAPSEYPGPVFYTILGLHPELLSSQLSLALGDSALWALPLPVYHLSMWVTQELGSLQEAPWKVPGPTFSFSFKQGGDSHVS